MSDEENPNSERLTNSALCMVRVQSLDGTRPCAWYLMRGPCPRHAATHDERNDQLKESLRREIAERRQDGPTERDCEQRAPLHTGPGLVQRETGVRAHNIDRKEDPAEGQVPVVPGQLRTALWQAIADRNPTHIWLTAVACREAGLVDVYNTIKEQLTRDLAQPHREARIVAVREWERE